MKWTLQLEPRMKATSARAGRTERGGAHKTKKNCAQTIIRSGAAHIKVVEFLYTFYFIFFFSLSSLNLMPSAAIRLFQSKNCRLRMLLWFERIPDNWRGKMCDASNIYNIYIWTEIVNCFDVIEFEMNVHKMIYWKLSWKLSDRCC